MENRHFIFNQQICVFRIELGSKQRTTRKILNDESGTLQHADYCEKNKIYKYLYT